MKLSRSQKAKIRWAKSPSARSRAGAYGWIAYVVYAVLFVLSDLLRPKPKLEQAKPSGVGDIKFPTATEGRVVPLGWGTFRCDGLNVIWYGDFFVENISRSVRVNMFNKDIQITGHKYFVGIQSALCMGPVEQMRRIWIQDKLVADYTLTTPVVHGETFIIDKPNLFGGESLGQGGLIGSFRFFAGTSTQSPSTYLSGNGVSSATKPEKHPSQDVFSGHSYFNGDIIEEASLDAVANIRAQFLVTGTASGAVSAIIVTEPGDYIVQPSATFVPTIVISSASPDASGARVALRWSEGFQVFDGVTPAYRDICYFAPSGGSTYVGNTLTLAPWRVELRRIPNGLALPSGHELIDGGANPINVIYELLTSVDWGYGIAEANIDTVNFTEAAATLFDEGNSFSFLLDVAIELPDFLRQIEDQIDGIVHQNPLTGVWRVKLIRGDFDIDTVPEVNATNMIELKTFTRGTWEGTTNQIRVKFNDADDDYKETFGFAQDMANVLVVGANVSATISYPGVSNRVLANSLAWRELRALSQPLSQAKFIVDRSFYGILPGDPFAFTDEDIGFNRLPMRVTSISYGDLHDGKITIEAIQDVFVTAPGVFEPPNDSGWQNPDNDVVPYPADEQIAFEAPRAMTLRDDESPVPETDKVYAAARNQFHEGYISIRERHAAGVPAGDFREDGRIFGFTLIGELASPLNLGGINPVSSVTLTADVDTQAALDAAFPTLTDVTALGTDLLSLCLIGDEFILVLSSQTSGDDVQLNQVYRGVLDSVQADHAAGTKVHLLFNGQGITENVTPAGDNVDIKLIPTGFFGDLDEAEAITIPIAMDNRTRRPYPPASFRLNGVELDVSLVSMTGVGSGEDVGVGITGIIRRDFRTAEEISPLGTDAASLAADFPANNSTEVEVEVRDGVTVLDSEVAIVGTSATMRQLDILQSLGTTTLPASLTFAVRQSHTFESVVYKSRVWLNVVATISSPLIGQVAFGVLDELDVSEQYTVLLGEEAIDHVFNLSTSFTVGDAEYRLDGGGWLTLIAAGATGPGTIPNASLSVGTIIEVRHGSTDTTPQKLLTMTISGTEKAYAVLIS